MRSRPLYNLGTKPKIIKKSTVYVGGTVLALVGMAVIGAVILLTMSGCASIDKAYVAADRVTYEAIGPEYTGYVNRDPDLREWEKSLRVSNVESWEDRITEAESK